MGGPGATGEQISGMTPEHYPGMTEKALQKIDTEAQARWPLEATLIIHRYGRLEPGDQIVFVAAASGHREAAFEACHFLIDWLKTKAPFWKLEDSSSGVNGWKRVIATMRRPRVGRMRVTSLRKRRSNVIPPQIIFLISMAS